MDAPEPPCYIHFDDNSNTLVVQYNKLYRGETDRDVRAERTEILLAVDDIFAESIPAESSPNPYLNITETLVPTYNYYKIRRIEDRGLNLICVEGRYDGHNVIWGQDEKKYTNTHFCEMLQLGRIKLGDEVPDPKVYMKVREGGTTKKRRFIKSKKSKQSKQSKRSKRSKKTKSKKARKSRRANRRHSRKH